MDVNKRRKLDSPAQPQAQSAFTQLRKLRSQAGASSTPVVAQSTAQQGQSTATAGAKVAGPQSATPKRPKRGHAAQAPLDASHADSSLQLAASGPSTPNASLADPEATADSSSAQKVPIVQFSNFKPNKSNFKKKPGGKLQLKLSEGERLVILGSYGIVVSSGEITLYGAVLRSSTKTYWVHAPHCHALPVIRCPEEATIELVPNSAAEGLRQLGTLSPLFRRLWNEFSGAGGNKHSDSTFSILYTSTDGPKRVLLYDLKSPPEWNREIVKLLGESRVKPLSVIVTGPKSAGKSTFGRLLTNQLLTEKSEKRQMGSVAVLDLDPGQPEFGPPGQVSLVQVTEPVLSPSFCRPLLPSTIGVDTSMVRSHTLASVSPASDPDLYIAAVADLVAHYRNRLGNLPLVVNTPGWVQGTGLDLLTSLIDLARPSHVIYMASGPIDVIESLQASFRSGEVTKLPSQTTQYTSRTAAQLRTMQTMSYFHSGANAGLQTRNIKPISAIAPWQVCYSGPAPGILGIMCYDYQAPANLLADALNGTVLAIVEVESSSAIQSVNMGNMVKASDSDGMDLDTDMPQTSGEIPNGKTTVTPEGIPFIQSGMTLDPKHSHTIGLALLRGIDTHNRMLHILSPIPEKRIRQINEKKGQIVLVSGKFDPPSWAYTEDLYHQSSSTNEGDADEEMDIIGEDEAVDSEHEPEQADLETASMPTPWIEVLRGNQKRGTASRVWRVRRDLGRGNNSN